MSTVVSRRRPPRLALAAGALVLGPVLLAAPAHADSTSPTPIASEPPGGATCLPGTSAACGQDQGVSATPTAIPTPTPTPTKASATPVASSSEATAIPVTGGTRPSLAKTGGGAASAWGYAGTGLLLGGSVLVLAGRRPRRAVR